MIGVDRPLDRAIEPAHHYAAVAGAAAGTITTPSASPKIKSPGATRTGASSVSATFAQFEQPPGDADVRWQTPNGRIGDRFVKSNLRASSGRFAVLQ